MLPSSARATYLLDGIGALVTMTSVGVVLPLVQPLIGLPVAVLRVLGGLAALLAAASLGRYFTGRTAPRGLAPIAFGNLAYCALTVGLIAWFWADMAPLGLLYFAGEMIIVVVLSRHELRLAAQPEEPPSSGRTPG